MKNQLLAKQWPQVGHSEERHCEDRKFKQKHHQCAGVALCPECHAVWLSKRWYVNAKKANLLAQDPLTRTQLCPGCDQIHKQMYEGEVYLQSPHILEIREDAFGLLEHTEARAYMHNPRSRIAIIEETADGMRIVTTTKWLAQRIGKEFEKAFKGTLKIKPLPNEKFVRVYWTPA